MDSRWIESGGQEVPEQPGALDVSVVNELTMPGC